MAGVSLAVSESDQRCLSWEELGTHSQKFCIGQTDRATSVGVCSRYMCDQACRHMCKHRSTRMHGQIGTNKKGKNKTKTGLEKANGAFNLFFF